MRLVCGFRCWEFRAKRLVSEKHNASSTLSLRQSKPRAHREISAKILVQCSPMCHFWKPKEYNNFLATIKVAYCLPSLLSEGVRETQEMSTQIIPLQTSQGICYSFPLGRCSSGICLEYLLNQSADCSPASSKCWNENTAQTFFSVYDANSNIYSRFAHIEMCVRMCVCLDEWPGGSKIRHLNVPHAKNHAHSLLETVRLFIVMMATSNKFARIKSKPLQFNVGRECIAGV